MFKRSKPGIVLFALLLMLSLVLAACNGDKADGDKNDDPVVDDGEKTDVGEPKDGGTIVGAMYSAPAGMFNPLFYTEAYEANILDFTHEGLFNQNDSLEFISNLAKDWELNDDNTELTIHLEEGVKWHDGEEFTANDVVYTYKVIADPDYVAAGGVRSSYVEPLLGSEAYTAGETKEFEGVVADGDYTVIFKFTEPNVTPEYIASFTIVPEHVFKDVAVADIPSAPESLEGGKVIGTGPFKFTDMVEREQYNLEGNKDYWKGAPHLDKVVWKVVQQSVMAGLLENGELDFVSNPSGIAPADFEMVNEYEHIKIIEQPDFGYQLLGFKINHRTTEDVEAGVIEPANWVPNEKLSNSVVRQAIAYAVNREDLVGDGNGKGLLHGHGQPINSPMATQFWAYDETAAINYAYDPEKAGKMLDEEGYVDKNDDGFREDPEGKEWVLNMDFPVGNELREKAAPILKEYLEEVGIKVNLRQPKEMSAYVEGLENDNTDWDLYMIGWSLSSTDPDPTGLWGTKAAYNFSRWNNPESETALQNALKAPEAFEQDYRAEVYSEWQKLYSEDMPALLLFAENSIWAYNDRIEGIVALPHTMYFDSHTWWVSGAE